MACGCKGKKNRENVINKGKKIADKKATSLIAVKKRTSVPKK